MIRNQMLITHTAGRSLYKQTRAWKCNENYAGSDQTRRYKEDAALLPTSFSFSPLYSSAGLYNPNENLCPCLLSSHQRIVFDICFYSSVLLFSSMRTLPCHIIESFLLRHLQIKIYPHGASKPILFFAIRSCRPRLPTTSIRKRRV